MTRSKARELAVHFVYQTGFLGRSAQEILDEMLRPEAFERLAGEDSVYAEFPDPDQRGYIEALVRGVGERSGELDGYIAAYAVGWKLSRLPKVAVAILRVCMYEILYMPDVPNAAAINEAVELTKSYQEPELAAYVNGILGSFVRQEAEK